MAGFRKLARFWRIGSIMKRTLHFEEGRIRESNAFWRIVSILRKRLHSVK